MRDTTTAAQPTRPRPSAFPTIIGLAAIIFGLDQVTKFLVLKNIPLGQSWDYFPGLARLFRITFIQNTGAAFGMFPQMGTILMAVAAIVVVAIIIFHHHLPVENIWIRLSLGLQLGGAMGNMIDRVIHGFVVDFVDIGFWPIFNVADAAIVTGVSILAYFLWDEEDDGEQPASQATQKADAAPKMDEPSRQSLHPPTSERGHYPSLSDSQVSSQ